MTRLSSLVIYHADHCQDHPAQGPQGTLLPCKSDYFSYPDQIDVEPADTVMTLKTKIEVAHGYPVSTQKVIYSGK